MLFELTFIRALSFEMLVRLVMLPMMDVVYQLGGGLINLYVLDCKSVEHEKRIFGSNANLAIQLNPIEKMIQKHRSPGYSDICIFMMGNTGIYT